MKERETDFYWDKLWKKDEYYAYHDIPIETDGISQLLIQIFKDSKPKQKILEIGSGPGTRTIPLAKKYNLNLTLLDRLESAHNLAKKRAERYELNINTCLGDAIEIPLNEPFDYVVSIGLNEHFLVNERTKVFEEQYRLTKKEGKMIVIVPNKLGAIRIEQIFKERLGYWNYGPTDLFTHNQLLEKMQSFDFSEVNMYGVSIITSFIRILPQNLQRKIFKNNEIWKRLVNIPGNFNLGSLANRYFGEEIMTVGYK